MTRLGLWCGFGAVVCAVAAVGCGGDDAGPGSEAGGSPDAGGDAQTSNGGRATGGSFKAVIDGKAWEATAMRVRSRIDEDLPGGYRLEGTSASLEQVRLELYYVDAPGTYDLGVTASVVGASGSYSRAPSIWQTPASGAAGKLEVRVLDAKRIAGAFEFVVVPVPGSQATGMVTITQGEFDVPLEGEATAIGPGIGRTLSAEFDGERFNAAAVVVTPYSGGISFNALNDAYNVGFVLGEVDGPGTYDLTANPLTRTVIVVAGSKGDRQTNCCWLSNGEGSVTFTTFDPERLIGTFEFTLAPMEMSPASAPLEVTSGVFDIGRRDP